MPTPDLILGAAIGAAISTPLTALFLRSSIADTRRRLRETQAELRAERIARVAAERELEIERRCHEAAMHEIARRNVMMFQPVDDHLVSAAVSLVSEIAA